MRWEKGAKTLVVQPWVSTLAIMGSCFQGLTGKLQSVSLRLSEQHVNVQSSEDAGASGQFRASQ